MNTGTLISKQNPDGGWPHLRGKSWTEPTVYAVLALLSTGDDAPAERGFQWIRRLQRPDGGWPARPEVDQSCWVTALAALLPPERLGLKPHSRAIRWLAGTIGEESTLRYRMREWLLGVHVPDDRKFAGWPWVPGSAAWVGPTSMTILALDQEVRRNPNSPLGERIHEGRQFLLRRMCAGGGWNHGSARPLGYESNAYPETTGMALSALRGMRCREVDQSVGVARQFLERCHSADALNWLRIGLLAHGELPAQFCPPSEISYRTVAENSLNLLVAAGAGGNSIFWA